MRARSARTGERFARFDLFADYAEHVDGKERAEGVGDFLRSIGVLLPEGALDDAPGVETIHGLANWKNQILVRLLRAQGARAYPGSLQYLRAVHAARLPLAVVSASVNCLDVLAVAGLAVQPWRIRETQRSLLS